MVFDKNTAKKTAELLLTIKAIKLSPEEPFQWASGWKSPIYCDNRITLSYVMIRNFIRENLSKIILEKHGQPDVVAGVATGAIAIGVLVAQELGVPFIYVRPEPKKHGRKNQIVGFLDNGETVVVVEDLISTGRSSLNAVEALREAGARVKGMVAIFSYGFDLATSNFADAHVDLTTLSDYENLLDQALHTNFIDSKQLKTLQTWREDPGNWDI